MTTRTVTARSLVAVGVLALSFAAFATLCLARRVPMADTLVYRAEGAAVVDGTDLYGFTVTQWRLPATYPPFAAILFVPTTWPPVGVLKCAFVVGNLALLALLVRLSGRFAGLRYGGPYGPVRPAPYVLRYVLPIALPVAAGLALWLEPVFQTVLFGQINLALACLVLWDLSRPEHAVGKGFALGVAAGVKLTPAIFLVYLLVTGGYGPASPPSPPSPAPCCSARWSCPGPAPTSGPAGSSRPTGSARRGSSTTSRCAACSPASSARRTRARSGQWPPRSPPPPACGSRAASSCATAWRPGASWSPP